MTKKKTTPQRSRRTPNDDGSPEALKGENNLLRYQQAKMREDRHHAQREAAELRLKLDRMAGDVETEKEKAAEAVRQFNVMRAERDDFRKRHHDLEAYIASFSSRRSKELARIHAAHNAAMRRLLERLACVSEGSGISDAEIEARVNLVEAIRRADATETAAREAVAEREAAAERLSRVRA